MAQRDLKINLLFNADTTLAQQNMQQLGNLLHSLREKTIIGFETGEIKQAVSDVQQLQIHLQNAVNVNTGKLDLSKFNTSLKKSHIGLEQYSSSLLSLGPTGQQAFARLATAISQAEVPMMRLSNRTREFMTTLANTAKWQVASTAIHGIAGAFSDTISYIEKFDKALTDIKIVSDLNDKQLLDFSQRTRNIAKEVNSTALDVAQASTIFFQQGLSTEQVEERVTTISKLVNITGESAEKVSSQMTSIWNNFSDGSQSLESYADILSYLGAKTAADTNQISTAMEKFAASAKTVGLSYEYASAAVAEVIDRTQMAPEEVGTAFKTIMSRMQGVKLGETLDDGVDLNKYGEALETVGVKVLDANNELRNADEILKDLGAKWDSLDSAEKKALATTVAGVRQQTQFIALMEEWDDIETTVAELGYTTGYLNEQNAEWADSIEGVKKQYEETKKAFIAKLFDSEGDEYIKDFYKMLMKLIEQVDIFVESFGGLKPMLLTIVGLFSKQLMPHLLDGTRNLMSNLATMFGITENRTKNLQKEFQNLASQKIQSGTLDTTMVKELTISQDLVTTKQRLQEAVKNSGQFEKDLVNLQIQQFEQASAVLQKELEKQHSLEQQVELQKQLLVSESRRNLGAAAAVNAFKQQNAAKPEEERMSTENESEIIDIATTSSVTEINDRITAIKEGSATAAADHDARLSSKTAERDALQAKLNQQKQVTSVYETQNAFALDADATQEQKQQTYKLLQGNNVEGATPGSAPVAKADFAVSKSAVREDFASPDVDVSELTSYEQLQRNIVQSKEEERRLEEEISQLNTDIGQIEEESISNGEEEIKNLEAAKKLREDIVKSRKEFTADTVVSTDEMVIDSASGSAEEAETRGFSSEIVSGALGDDGGITAAFNEANGQLNVTMETSINNVEKLVKKRAELGSITDQAAAQEKDLEAAIKKMSSTTGKADGSTKKFGKSIKNGTKELKKAKKDAQSFSKEITKMIKSLSKGKQGEKYLKDLEKAMEKIEKAANMDEAEAGFKDLLDILQKVKNGATEAGVTVDEAVDTMLVSLKESGASGAALDNLEKQLKELGLWSQDTANKFAQLRNEMSTAPAPVVDFASTMSNAITKVSSFAGALSSAFAAKNMLTQAFTEAESGEEAFMNFLTGASMLLPIVAGAFKGLALAKKLVTLATKDENKEIEQNTQKQHKNLIATAWAAAGKAWSAAVSSFGWVGAIIGAVLAAAIVAALVGGAIAAVKAGNANKKAKEEEDKKAKEDQEKAKVAIETAKGLANELNEAKQKAEEVSQGFADYNEIAKKLADCKKGTQEWNEALEENNKKVAELIEKYPELAEVAGGVTMGADGQLVISDEAMNMVRKAAGRDVARAQLAQYYNQKDNREKEIGDKEKERDKQKKNLSTDTKSIYEDIMKKYGSDDAIQHLQEYNLNSNQFDVLKNMFEAEKDLAAAVRANTSATEAQTMTLGAQIMAGNAEYENSNYKENIAAIAGENLLAQEVTDVKSSDSYDQILKDISARTEEDKDNPRWNKEKNDPILQEFYEIMGIDQRRNSDALHDGFKMEVYNEETNEWEEKEYTDEFIARTVAADRQMKNTDEFNNMIAEQMNSFDTEDAADIFTAAYTGKTEFLSSEMLEKSNDEINKIIDSMEISEDVLKEMGYEIDGTPESIEAAEKAFKKYSKEITASTKGFNDLKKHGVTALALINDANKTTMIENGKTITKWSDDAKRAAQQISQDLSAALGADSDLGLDPDFIEKNKDIIEDFMNGVEGAGDRLRTALNEDAVFDIKAKFEGDTEVQNKIQSLHDELLSLADEDWKIGVEIDNSDFIAKCNEMIVAAAMTQEEAQEYFGKMGYDVEFTTQKKKLSEVVWDKYYTNKTDSNGNLISSTVKALPKVVEGEVEVPAIKTITPNASFGGNIKNIGSSGITPPPPITDDDGGGGGDKPKEDKEFKETDKKETKQYHEEFDRYKELTDSLEEYERELENIQALKDEAWGPDRLKAMEEEEKKLKDLIKGQQLYVDAIATYDSQGNLNGGYLKTDNETLQQLDARASFDQDGRLNNYKTLTEAWLAENNAAQEAWNQAMEAATIAYNSSGKTEADEEAYEAAKEAADDALEAADTLYSKRKEALDQQEESYKKSIEEQEQLKEYERQLKQLNYDKIMFKIEFKIEVNDRELKKLDSEIGRIEDDFYKSAEVMAKIQSKTQFYDDSDTGILMELTNAQKELTAEYQAGNITQAQYIEGLQKIQDQILDNIDALYEMNETMQAYYSDTLDAGIQKIKDMASHFDHLTSRLQHYQNMVNLLGQEQNYDMQNTLLQSQIEILNDKIKTSKDTIAMLEDELAWAQTRYSQAKTEEEKEEYLKRIQAISQALEEEEEAYLSYVEEVGEAANQILTNSIEKAFKDIANEMTDNLGFDAILDSMERLNTLSAEYLTNTNKMYETNKLIGNAQQKMNKTQNLQAKQQYQDYIKYIEQLQISGNLTQTELKIAQAKYKVLEAEIALEEAKNAKAQVRLTRNSEGNFGYIYTADQDQIYETQQGYLDAQNELYNIGLETSNGYRQKIVELQQQTLEDLKQLEIDYRVNHLMSEEEYEQRKLAIIETAQETLNTYQEQYNLGQQVMVETQYSTLQREDENFQSGQLSSNKNHYELMEIEDNKYYGGLSGLAENTRTAIDNTFNGETGSLSYDLGTTFKKNLEKALGDCKDATDTWKKNMQPIIEAVGISFDGTTKDGKEGLKQKIDKTLASSKALATFITDPENGLITAISKEMEQVRLATEKWDAHWASLQTVINKYKELYELTGINIEEATEPEIPPPPDDGDDEGNNGDGNNKQDDEDNQTGIGENQSETGNTLTSALIDELATRMIRGDFGNGRQTRLTALQKEYPWMTQEDYQIIQDEVNRRAPFAPVTPKATSDNNANNEDEKLFYPTDGGEPVTKKELEDKGALEFSDTELYIPGDVEEIFEDPYKVFPDVWDEVYVSDTGFDTGGYTGSWGPEGKMAMLHEKELVLNKQDTENFLTATNILREISDVLDNNALIASLGAINLSAMNINSPADQILQQEVNIHADFPNVVDHNEIEIAIDNLINAASQHAYRQ